LPAVFPDEEAVAEGGLMSYGSDTLDDLKRGVDQVVRAQRNIAS
jgi:hypothetical protein